MNNSTTRQERARKSVFIRVYVDDLRDLVARCNLTRAEIGELLLVACYMNEDGQCWPSNGELAGRVGFRSSVTVSRLHKSLRAKGALDWCKPGATNCYQLPDAFSYGKNYYQESNRTPGGESNWTPGGESNWTRTQSPTGLPKKNQQQQKKSRSEEENTEADQIPLKRGGITDAITTYSRQKAEQIGNQVNELDPIHAALRKMLLEQTLKQIGIDPREARLMVNQYAATGIERVLAAAAQRTPTRNQAGYVRRMLEAELGGLVFPSAGKLPTHPDDKPLSREERFSNNNWEQAKIQTWKAEQRRGKGGH